MSSNPNEKDKYYASREYFDGYVGRIYFFDASGNKEITYWESKLTYDTPEAAQDAAIEYADENDIELAGPG